MLKYSNTSNLAYKGYEKYSIARDKRSRASPVQDGDSSLHTQTLKIEATGNGLASMSKAGNGTITQLVSTIPTKSAIKQNKSSTLKPVHTDLKVNNGSALQLSNQVDFVGQQLTGNATAALERQGDNPLAKKQL